MNDSNIQCPERGDHVAHGVVAKHGAYWCPGRESAASETTAPPLTIVEFIEARLSADEQMCSRTPGGAFKVTSLDGGSEADEEAVQQYYHRFQPEWMVLDLAAKRELVKREIAAYLFDGVQVGTPASTPVLRILAGVYRDHPDYDPRWAV